MNPRKLTLCTIIALLGATSTLAAADVYVIANSGTTIAPGEIKEVFTGDKQFVGPTKLLPVDNGPAQDEFLSSALKMDVSRYNTIWTKKSFREGLNPPPVKSGDTEVIDYVKKTPGAVGYVKSSPSGVTVIQKF